MIRLLLLSIILLFVTSCAYNPYETRGQRTVKGVLLGAGAGGVIGHQKGKGLEGALIGGVIGGILGSLSYDERPKEHYQHNHNQQQDTILIRKRKVIVVEEEVPLHRETNTYYYDEHGNKIYVDKRGHRRRTYNPVTE